MLPGPFWTPAIATQDANTIRGFGTFTMLKRAGRPEQIAPAYVFLAADASFSTGALPESTGGFRSADQQQEINMSDQSEQLERRYKVRQVTNIQASWTERERGQPGKFTLQLILDNGVEEYILDTAAEDIDVVLKLFGGSAHTTFDLERKVLMFSNLSVK